ncbi:hypothetical protein OsI_02747 [Oryza sativa Indica Group]|uniref:Uncharacterized protein n=1 Tax=Oryza sativa subsp. indica TaxID=39946 RepID=B8ABH6_ORYSI|nr:hypothetical protein OsI_02747 [Oryza sativa Indica Group]
MDGRHASQCLLHLPRHRRTTAISRVLVPNLDANVLERREVLHAQIAQPKPKPTTTAAIAAGGEVPCPEAEREPPNPRHGASREHGRRRHEVQERARRRAGERAGAHREPLHRRARVYPAGGPQPERLEGRQLPDDADVAPPHPIHPHVEEGEARQRRAAHPRRQRRERARGPVRHEPAEARRRHPAVADVTDAAAATAVSVNLDALDPLQLAESPHHSSARAVLHLSPLEPEHPELLQTAKLSDDAVCRITANSEPGHLLQRRQGCEPTISW